MVFLWLLSPLAYSADLKCAYIQDIQQKYINTHIHFSSAKKQKSFYNRRINSLERRLKKQFIKSIDSEKIYFTVFDVKNINNRMNGIFRKVKKGNCSDLNAIYDLYYKRVSERTDFANQYLKAPFEINTSVRLVLDSDKRKRPITQSQINKFHEKYIQYQMANAIIASDKEEYKDQLAEAKKNILRSYDRALKQVQSWSVNLSKAEKQKCYRRKKSFGQVKICRPDEWYSIYLNSFARSLDPHSSYLSQADHEDFEINMKLALDGVGASLSAQYGHTVIERLLPGGAAARSGKLKVKDKILAVGQSAKKMVNIFDMGLRDVVSMIRGKKGTPVYLKILRPEKNKKKNIFTVRLIRSRVQLEDQAADIFYFDKKIEGKTHKAALLRIPSFYGENRSGGRSAAKDVRRLLKQAKKKNISALVLDLSNNGGGALHEAVRVAGLFFARGSVVRQLVKTKNGDRYLTLSDIDESVEYTGPMVVLVNRISASAAEIVSGALKSYKRAIVVGGDHTFGKGTIQSVERLPRGLGSIRVTVGLFFTPDGFSTQLKGVLSDISFPSIYSHNDIGEKTLDYVLPKKRIPSFVSDSAYVESGPRKWAQVSDVLTSFLQKKSLKRMKKDSKFKEIKKDILELEEKRKQGFAVTVAEIFDKSKKDDDEEEKEEENFNTRQARNKRYMERPDVKESVNIAFDQLLYQHSYQASSRPN